MAGLTGRVSPSSERLRAVTLDTVRAAAKNQVPQLCDTLISTPLSHTGRMHKGCLDAPTAAVVVLLLSCFKAAPAATAAEVHCMYH